MRYEIQELGIGGILDQAINLTRNHFGLFVGILLVLQIPFGLIQGGFYLAFMPTVDPAATPQQQLAVQQQSMQYLWLIGLFGLLGGLLVFPVTNAAIVHAVANKYLDRRVTVGEAFKRALRIFLPLVWTWILLYLAVMGGLILLIIPGILCAFWFALATQIVVVEGISGVAALKRSKQLMRGNIGTVFALGLLVGVINWSILAAVGLVPQQHLQMLVRVLVQAILTVFASAAFVVFYFSARCQHEHFDLTLLAESVAEDSGEEHSAIPAE